MSKHDSKGGSSLDSNSTIDPLESQPIIIHHDGSVTRLMQIPNTKPTQDPDNIILSKDVPINPINKTSIRLFLPQKTLHNSKKFP